MARVECKWFRPANPAARGTRDAWAAEFPPPGISGVYAIANLRGVVLYVGESHTGRLRKTLARHFQLWDDPTQPRHVYDRHRVQVCWMQTAPADALHTEADWTIELDPRDNLADPYEVGYPAFDDVDEPGEYDDAGDDYEGAQDDEVPF